MQDLTPRQSEIKALLDDGLSAREAASALGITRNAVYQQITAMKRKGMLVETFTPTGETRIPPPGPRAEEMVRLSTSHNMSNGDAQLEVIAALVEMNRELVASVRELSAQVGELAASR